MYKTLISAMASLALMLGASHAAEFAACIDQTDHGNPSTCLSQTPFIVAQQRMKTLRVPSGKTYQVQIGRQSTFQKFSAGATVGGTDCVQVACPSTFEDDVTCWKCQESLTSAN